MSSGLYNTFSMLVVFWIVMHKCKLTAHSSEWSNAILLLSLTFLAFACPLSRPAATKHGTNLTVYPRRCKSHANPPFSSKQHPPRRVVTNLRTIPRGFNSTRRREELESFLSLSFSFFKCQARFSKGILSKCRSVTRQSVSYVGESNSKDGIHRRVR